MSKCTHKEARLDVWECGMIAIHCDCSFPLVELNQRCTCKDYGAKYGNPRAKMLVWDDMSNIQALRLYVRLAKESIQSPEMDCA